jgi:hypothetical protein
MVRMSLAGVEAGRVARVLHDLAPVLLSWAAI